MILTFDCLTKEIDKHLQQKYARSNSIRLRRSAHIEMQIRRCIRSKDIKFCLFKRQINWFVTSAEMKFKYVILFRFNNLLINKCLPTNHVEHNKSPTNFYASHVTHSAIVQSECRWSVNEDDHKFRIEQLNKASSILARKSDWLLQQPTAQHSTQPTAHNSSTAQQGATAHHHPTGTPPDVPRKRESERCHGAAFTAQQSSQS